MKGIFELRTPEPRLCSSLELLASLSLKDLCLKLTILLALTSAAPAHELAALDLTCIVRKEDSYTFMLRIRDPTILLERSSWPDIKQIQQFAWRGV